MPKKGSKRCRGCGVLFTPETAGDRICAECKELIAVGGTKDIFEFERLRDKFNRRHGKGLTYGQFDEYIGVIKARVKK